MSGMLCMLVGSSSAFNFNATISSNTTNYSLATALTAAGWNGIDRVIATITVNSGVYLGSTSISSPAFTVGSLPAASTVSLTNNGYILGKGGDGGDPYGGNGGPAMTIGSAITITNNSIIGGGGGAGGQGARYVDPTSGVPGGYSPGGGGGGGAGYLTGAGGPITPGGYSNFTVIDSYASNGTNSSGTSPGSGGSHSYGFIPYVSPNTYSISGGGGSGGDLGASGGTGGNAYSSGEDFPAFITGYGYAGGSAGNCTTTGSNVYITWAVAGTRYGTLG